MLSLYLKECIIIVETLEGTTWLKTGGPPLDRWPSRTTGGVFSCSCLPSLNARNLLSFSLSLSLSLTLCEWENTCTLGTLTCQQQRFQAKHGERVHVCVTTRLALRDAEPGAALSAPSPIPPDTPPPPDTACPHDSRCTTRSAASTPCPDKKALQRWSAAQH